MSTHDHRLRFLEWMIELGLDHETADAILRGMAPFDWHELSTKKDLEQFATKTDLERFATKADFEGFATKADLQQVRTEMATKADLASFGTELRGEMNSGFAQLRLEMEGIRKDVRLVLLAVLGFMLSVVLAAAGAGITLAA